ncbi:MAG TPA: YdeI/OmpD-associated family protein [Bryobacteraceae bacterium]|nr:YdeI/OmpD-associated family protein [Bryobacteraceae bacterium]
MPTDRRVDQYIARAPEFAQPILAHLRELVHKGCPEVEEAIKWSTPSFVYRKKLLFSMGGFKAHCRFIFWRPEIAKLAGKQGTDVDDDGTIIGKVTQLSDLPSDKDMLRYIREACRLTDEGPRVTMRKRTTPKPELAVPAEFAAALAKNKKAATAFQDLSPSHRREYLEWIISAKHAETRDKRIDTAVAWLVEGKPRNWKYMS